MRYLRPIAVAAALCALAGCASVAKGVPASAAAMPAGEAGWVFGSLNVPRGTPFTSHGFKYRAVGAADGALVSFRYDARPAASSPLGIGKLLGEKPDFVEQNEAGIVFAYRLPPGEYELYDVHFHRNGGQIQTSYSARMPFAIRFRVEQGAATYLGEFQARSGHGTNIVGMPVVAGGYFALRDRKDRDLARLQAKGTELPRARVIDATADVLAARVPFFQENAVAPPAH